MPLTRVSKTITKIGEIIVAHCQPARVDAVTSSPGDAGGDQHRTYNHRRCERDALSCHDCSAHSSRRCRLSNIAREGWGRMWLEPARGREDLLE